MPAAMPGPLVGHGGRFRSAGHFLAGFDGVSRAGAPQKKTARGRMSKIQKIINDPQAIVAEVLDGLSANGEEGNAGTEQTVATKVKALTARFPIY